MPTAEYVSEITLLSLFVSGMALLFSSILGVAAGALIGLYQFRGRSLIRAVLNALMGLPPVVLGLLLVIALGRSGPLGFLHILYTPKAMILAQTLLALPIITSISAAAFSRIDKGIIEQLSTMGISPAYRLWLLTREAATGIASAIAAGAGRIFAEVGAVLLVGGNIKHSTRVLTTAIVLETRKGEYTNAAYLSFVLLGISLTIAAVLTWLQYKRVPDEPAS